jgi:hypothetical protein
MKTKNPKDIQIGDKVLLQDTGFEYVVTYTTEASILINRSGLKYWLPKSLLNVIDAMLSTHGYRLWKIGPLPNWLIKKDNII